MPSSNETVKPAAAANARDQANNAPGPVLPLDPSQPVSADEMMSQEEISALLAEIKAEQESSPKQNSSELPAETGSTAIAPQTAQAAPQADAQTDIAGISKLTAFKPLVMITALILLLLVGSGAYFAATVSQATPEQAGINQPEAQLKTMGVRYLPDDFVKYAGRGNKQITELFLKSGMSPDVYRSSDGFTPLMAAASFGRLETISLLIKQGASLNSKDKDGQTALMKAAAYNYPEAAQLLLQTGADYSISDNRGRTAASLALEKKDPQMLKLLTQAGIVKPNVSGAEKTASRPAAVEKQPSPPVEFSLAGRKAGYMEIGQPLTNLYQQYDRKNAAVTTVYTPSPAVKVYLDGRATPSLIGSVSIRNQGTDKIIDGIQVFDDRFKTAAGIGINSTLGDLRKADAFSDIKHIDQSLYAIAKGIAFELAISMDTLPVEWLETGQTSSLSDNIRIQSIIVR